MRIAFAAITPSPHTGGLWTVLTQLFEGLKSHGHETTLVTPEQMPEHWMPLINRLSQGVRVTTRSWLWFFVRMWLVSRALGFLASRLKLWDRTDLLDAQDPAAFLGLWRMAKKRGIPTILTLHGYFHYESNIGSVRPDSFWGQMLIRLEKKAYSRASMIVTVDTRLRDYVIRLGIPDDKVAVRINTVDTSLFSPSTSDVKEAERRRLNIPANTRAVCCARRLEEKNGVEFAIRSLRVLRDGGFDATLLVAGRGSLEEKLKALTSELQLRDMVRFLGNVERADMAKMLKACDVAVVPSVTVGEEQEATSLSALEAMASGIPVVASSIGGLKELITDGVTGLLVEERNPSAIAEAIERATGLDGSGLGRAAREEAISKFSRERGIDVTLSVYDAVRGGGIA